MHTNNITKVVNIKGLNITKFQETDDEIIFYGNLFNHRKDCPKCHSTKIEVHDYRIQKIRDIPIRDKKTIIAFKRKRFKCKCCGKNFETKAKFVSSKCQITNRLKFRILNSCRHMISLKTIAENNFVSTNTVSRILKSIEIKRLKLGKVLNIDEFKGDCNGIKYQSILSNSNTKEIVDILPSRFYEDLKTYFDKIDKEELSNVKVFVSDMSTTFRSVHNKYFSRSTHVIDRYHFIRQITWALENVRKNEQISMSKSMRIYFKRSKSLLSKPQVKLTTDEKEKLITMLGKNEKIRLAYLLKESFYSYVLTSENSKEAKEKLKAWINYAKDCKMKEFNVCIRAYTNWFNEICNSFDYEYSNGYVEGCNNKTKILKRISYGCPNFTTLKNRRLLIA